MAIKIKQTYYLARRVTMFSDLDASTTPGMAPVCHGDRMDLSSGTMVCRAWEDTAGAPKSYLMSTPYGGRVWYGWVNADELRTGKQAVEEGLIDHEPCPNCHRMTCVC